MLLMPKSSSTVFFICGSQEGGMFQCNIFFIACNTLFTISRKTSTLSCYHFPEIQTFCLVASNDQNKSELFTHSVTLSFKICVIFITGHCLGLSFSRIFFPLSEYNFSDTVYSCIINVKKSYH